jgi:hypothetical protein
MIIIALSLTTLTPPSVGVKKMALHNGRREVRCYVIVFARSLIAKFPRMKGMLGNADGANAKEPFISRSQP